MRFKPKVNPKGRTIKETVEAEGVRSMVPMEYRYNAWKRFFSPNLASEFTLYSLTDIIKLRTNHFLIIS